jgi:hypothetical protein
MEDETEKRVRGPIAKIEPMFPRRPPSKAVRVGPHWTLSTAIDTVVVRNRLDGAEAALLRRCLERALSEMHPEDRKACAKRLVGRMRFISVLANNHLAIRAPAYSDSGRRHRSSDIILAWPKAVRPSVLSTSRFRGELGGFSLVKNIGVSSNLKNGRVQIPFDSKTFTVLTPTS